MNCLPASPQTFIANEDWPFCPCWSHDMRTFPEAQQLDLEHRIRVARGKEVCICNGLDGLRAELYRRGFQNLMWRTCITWPKWLAHLTRKWGYWYLPERKRP